MWLAREIIACCSFIPFQRLFLALLLLCCLIIEYRNEYHCYSLWVNFHFSLRIQVWREQRSPRACSGRSDCPCRRIPSCDRRFFDCLGQRDLCKCEHKLDIESTILSVLRVEMHTTLFWFSSTSKTCLMACSKGRSSNDSGGSQGTTLGRGMKKDVSRILVYEDGSLVATWHEVFVISSINCCFLIYIEKMFIMSGFIDIDT